MSNELIFYTNPMSRGRTIRWVLEEIGQPYRTELLDYGSTIKGAEYLAINPMGKVPAIKHGDTVVTEAAAIVAYLADAFPQAGLAPATDSPDRGAYYRWIFFAAGPLESALVAKALGFEAQGDQQRMAGWGSFDLAINTVEAAVAGRPFIAGDRFSAADIYLSATLAWGLQTGGIPQRSAFTDYVAIHAGRPAALRGRAIDDALLAG